MFLLHFASPSNDTESICLELCCSRYRDRVKPRESITFVTIP